MTQDEHKSGWLVCTAILISMILDLGRLYYVRSAIIWKCFWVYYEQTISYCASVAATQHHRPGGGEINNCARTRKSRQGRDFAARPKVHGNRKGSAHGICDNDPLHRRHSFQRAFLFVPCISVDDQKQCLSFLVLGATIDTMAQTPTAYSGSFFVFSPGARDSR